MNEAATLQIYYEERIRSLGTLLQKPKNEITTGDIHKLRVELKKIRALAHLLQYCATGFNEKKFMKPYLKIFNAAGSLRELQLQKSRLKKQGAWTLLEHYADNVKKAQKRAKARFRACINQPALQKIQTRHEMILPYFNAVQEAAVAQYLQMKEKQIYGLVESHNLKEKQTHKLRSLLKEVHYTILMFVPGTPQLDNLDALQELLGQWHDAVVLNAYLEKAVDAGRLPHFEIELLKQVRHKLAAETNQLFEAIRLKLFNFQLHLASAADADLQRNVPPESVQSNIPGR